MIGNQSQTTPAASGDADELGDAESDIAKKYVYLAMALLILTAIILIFLRFVLYLW